VLVVDGGVVTGPPGSSVLVTPITPGGATCPNGGVRITQLADGGNTNICNGADGMQGPAGMMGAQGPQGPAGMMGAQGQQGMPGPAGMVGPQGLTGPSGPAGAVLYLDGGVVVVPQATRPKLLGYTAFTSNGNMGGRTAANTRCNSEFPGTHLCNVTELRVARSALPLNAAAAWLDYPYESNSAPTLDPDFGSPCNNFTYSGTTAYYAEVATPQGYPVGGTVPFNCSMALPLACCTSPSPVRLRGYTAFSSNGAMGGRTAANARCDAEFPGAHLCNVTEFRVARSAVPLNATGAWLDYPYESNSSPTLDPDFGSPCNNFTYDGGTAYYAEVATPQGYPVGGTVPFDCSMTLPLACCD
jgi:hypothetical protein